jgi:RNA polymerase sigma-70 factor (ECF subfamily)
MVGHDEADELTQDVFVRVWEKLATFRGEAAFGTWIHRVAINVMLARQDTRRRDRERFEDDDTRADAAASKPREAESRIDFEAALETLPAGARRVLVLHDVEGYKHHEIAEMLKITVGTSKSQLHRARMLMRDQLVA